MRKNFQIGERIVAKFNYVYLNPDSVRTKRQKNRRHTVLECKV